jgi:integrase
MNITYSLTGTKEIKKVKVRLYHNKLDIPVTTNLVSKAENWDSDSQLFKKNNTVNKKLIELKENIANEFNTDFSNGEIIDKQWLNEVIKRTFFRPNKERKMQNHKDTVYLYDFGKDWLENKSGEWRNSNSKPLTKKAKGQYMKALELFGEYQGKRNIKLRDFSLEEIKGFFHFLIDKNYSFPTAKKKLTELKFLCDKAKNMNLNVNTDYLTKTIFKDTAPEIEEIYLNDAEIESIFNQDFSDNDLLDIIRDNFILCLWSGLRISDLVTLDSNNIINGMIETISVKTKTLAKVPLHPQVKYILEKRFGNLPPKVKKDEYNIQIKEICRICKIDQPVYGKIYDKKKDRDIAGYYPKYKLVSSHIARRSFATNLSDKISTKAISKMIGHSNEKITEFYNKKSKLEYADELSKIWDSQNKKN